MPYTNYAELQAGIKGWLHRTDLKARVPEFIALAEQKLNRMGSVQSMEQTASLSIGAGNRSVSLPAGYMSPISARLDDGGDLVQRVPEDMPLRTSAGAPAYWCIDGTSLVVDAPADVARTVQLRYRGGFTLSDASPTNALLSKYPDLYLYGALLQTAAWSRSAENLALWNEMYNAAVREVNRTESRARASAPLRTELAGLLGCH